MITIQITREELEVLEDAVEDFVENINQGDYSGDADLQAITQLQVTLLNSFMDRIRVPVREEAL